jgi:hypothetical protein
VTWRFYFASSKPLGADLRQRAAELDPVDPDVDEVERGLLVASQQRRHLDRVEHRVVRHRRKLRILPLGA